MTQPNLPITERRRPCAEMDPVREAEIGRLVERFYQRGRTDPLIGPVFEAHVKDWDAHLARMRDFWTSAIYRTGRYAGRPLEVHRRLAELRPEHFDRWLALWEQAVEQTVRSEARGDLIGLARRMAMIMAGRLGGGV